MATKDDFNRNAEDPRDVPYNRSKVWTKAQKERLEKIQEKYEPDYDIILPDGGQNSEYDREKNRRARLIHGIQKEIDRNKGTLKRDFQRSRDRKSDDR